MSSTMYGNLSLGMKKIQTISIVCACLILLLVVCIFSGRQFFRTAGAEENDSIRLVVYPTEKGWGYDVEMNGRTVIHQPFMPVAAGEAPFEKEEDARKAGKMVVEKIKANDSPALTREDLSRAGIAIP